MNRAAETEVWQSCYDESWKGLIVEKAFAHPAKFSRGLIRRIYRELLGRGWLHAGDTVVDPFGGVALGGLDAMAFGLHWVGMELEEHFQKLGNENIDRWREIGFPGTATLLRGDSRQLAENLSASAVVSSPPFLGAHNGTINGTSMVPPHDTKSWTSVIENDGYGGSPGQLGGMPEGNVDAVVGSPPFIDARQDTTASRKGATAPTKHDPEAWAGAVIASPPYASGTVNKFDTNKPEQVLRAWFDSYREKGGGMSYEKFVNHVQAGRSAGMDAYGSADGQLGSMSAGTVDAVIGSPPFSGTEQPCQSQTRAIKDYHAFTRGNGTKRDGIAQSSTDGQLSAMPTGDVDAIVSSPPFEATDTKPTAMGAGRGTRANGDGAGRNKGDYHYPESPGQLGTDSGETFWSAAREIVIQCHAILKPGGIAAFVCKDFVRKGQRVPFSDDWRRLCEACGFELALWAQASLVKEQRSPDLFGGEHVKRRERKSFFRRLAEKKGSPAIDHEDVLFLRRP